MLGNTTDPTEAALHAGILAEPWNDVLRLMLADELDENAGRVECSECKGKGYGYYEGSHGRRYRDYCSTCHGSGTVSDGRAEQASFIRVQIELAQLLPPDVKRDLDRGGIQANLEQVSQDTWKRWPEVCALRKRERELWANPRLPVGFVPRNWGLQLVGDDVTSDLPGYLFVSRGFVSEVRCTMRAFLGGECARCNGFRTIYREFPSGRGRSGSAQAQLVDYCSTCNGEGRVEGIAAALFAAHPVTKVVLTDVVIHQSGWNDAYYVDSLGQVPREHWSKLENLPSRSAALDALSAVCVAYGRALAGQGASQ